MKAADVLKATMIGLTLLVGPSMHAMAQDATVSAAAQSAVTARVNINTADAQTLASMLRGIGPSKAEAIVAYRNEHGPFRSVDELINVKGIGEKTLEQLRPQLSL